MQNLFKTRKGPEENICRKHNIGEDIKELGLRKALSIWG
jgi:hypothetical protein